MAAKHEYNAASAERSMKFGNIERVETSRYLTRITIHCGGRPIAKVLAAKHTASLRLLARSDARTEFKISQRSLKGGGEAGRAQDCSS